MDSRGLLPRFRRRQLDAEDKAKVEKAIQESIDVEAQPKASLPGDTRKLRGIPIQGFGGAIPGTRPDKRI